MALARERRAQHAEATLLRVLDDTQWQMEDEVNYPLFCEVLRRVARGKAVGAGGSFRSWTPGVVIFTAHLWIHESAWDAQELCDGRSSE